MDSILFSILLILGVLLAVVSLVARNNIAIKYRMAAVVAVCGFLIAFSLNLVSESRTALSEQSPLELHTSLRTPELSVTRDDSSNNSDFALSGTAEAGSQVDLYVQVGSATADSSGKWSYSLKSDHFLNNQEYDLKAVATNARGDRSAFSKPEKLDFSEGRSDVVESSLVYESTRTENVDYVVVRGLDQVCSTVNQGVGVFKDTSLNYDATFQGREVHGKMTFTQCNDQNVDASGKFQDEDNCEGEVSFIVTDSDSSYRIKGAILYWKYSYCPRGTSETIATVHISL
jgi:hypothetical protein